MGTHDERGCPRSDRRAAILRALGSTPDLHEGTPHVAFGRTWHVDTAADTENSGVDGIELTWTVPGETAPTEAWLLTPANRTDRDLPAVLLLHAHDGIKFHGKEKVADGPDGPIAALSDMRRRGYDGRSVAAGLVAAGFAVLVHDVFPWGSRRVAWEDFPERAKKAAGASALDSSARYEVAAREHEHGLAKTAALTGSSLARQVLREDLVALEVLRGIPGVDASRIGVAGFSGGGARVAHLLAAAEVKAAVITAMMSTFADVADGHADDTTWLMITPGLPAVCDWPDVAASGFPTPLLVQFARRDSHFGPKGMSDAEAALQHAYGGSDALTTQWFEGGHVFTSDMQDAAAAWLGRMV
ncbi:hypothetical protein CH304_08320 [Rhodococcus sp. 15-649-1-2]|uniref:dienelactone hydrolase family protein n=1 Tax=Rhodococcus sp. 114MFTsu3.1 TaxID=1172184 RepID=UPI00036C993E|nr:MULTISPECIES: hypothetical protein [unclassified Rhodococcus (in: high G+C Gram-positive bacteria)]OZE83674.1 hypothetical protein CH304_08320 [Rhodococcus sp. 15-649-1-2]OZF06589.1 hypothetical protein CH300_07220 [Rhodococcus sp. 15-1154-1]